MLYTKIKGCIDEKVEDHYMERLDGWVKVLINEWMSRQMRTGYNSQSFKENNFTFEKLMLKV